jgi:hypothetical protein
MLGLFHGEIHALGLEVRARVVGTEASGGTNRSNETGMSKVFGH